MRTRRIWLPPGVEPEPAPGWVLVSARVIRREYRTVGYRSKKTGRLVSLAAARRWPGKMQTVKRLARVRWELREKREKGVPEVWEVTVTYHGQKHVEDITVRLVARDRRRRFTAEEARAAFWVAHKRGPGALRDWKVQGMDWRGYHYPSGKVSLAEALQNAGGIFTTVGLEALRVARVEA